MTEIILQGYKVVTWELDFIKWLQSGSVPLLDYLIYFITQFGTELFFMLAVMILYWCVDKKEGFRLVNVFMLSQITVGIIKTVVGRVRPYYQSGITPILEQTDGYSFPSGHSNNMAVISTFGAMFAKRKDKFFKQALIIACVSTFLVMFSRVYLGQHYPTDVIVGALLGVGMGIVGFILFDKLRDSEEKLAYAIVPLCACIFITSIIFYFVKGEEIDSLMTIAGTYSAAAIGYYIEKRHICFEVKSDKKWKYFVRVLIGAVIVIAIKEGLKALFGLFDAGVLGLIMRFIRYFLIGIFVTVLAPMLFKKFKI